MQQSMRDTAYRTIREWLHAQELPKGSVTSEVQLSKRLDMSRTPVRAALQQLEQEGYLRIIPKHGILILESSAQRVGDLLDLIFAMILFSYEQNSRTQPLLTARLEGGILAVQAALSAEDASTGLPQSEPEQIASAELRLLRELAALSRNAEMDRLFEQSIERLYWHNNTRRWRSPYHIETRASLLRLLGALTQQPPEAFSAPLLAHLQILKKTWR